MFTFVDEVEMRLTHAWNGPVAFENRVTNDGRIIRLNALDIPPGAVHLPLTDPYMGTGEHENRVGTLDEIRRTIDPCGETSTIHARGMTNLPPGRYTVGIDLATDAHMTFMGDIVEGRIVGLVIEPTPTWPEAHINVT